MATKLGSNPNGVVATVPTHVAATPLGLTVTGRFSQGSSRLATLICSLYMFSYVFSGYDFLPFSHGQLFPPSHSSRGVLFAARFHGGERSEPEGNRAAKSCRETAFPAVSAPIAVLPAFGYCVPFDLLLFLHRQEHEAGALAQRAVGGVRELVQPSDGLGPVRSPARAAHARCSKLERLPERRPRPSARISKDE
jgi:hypothetical protein